MKKQLKRQKRFLEETDIFKIKKTVFILKEGFKKITNTEFIIEKQYKVGAIQFYYGTLNYKYNIGIRKIALFPYQSRSRLFKGNENSLSDDALFGAVGGLEYLISASFIRNQGHEYTDNEYWLKWSNDITTFE